MDKCNGEVGRVKETKEGNGGGGGWEESNSGNREGRRSNYWDEFAMVLCNYFVVEVGTQC